MPSNKPPSKPRVIDDAGSNPVRNMGDDTVIIHGRCELLPNMGISLHHPLMTYYRQGIYDCVALNQWNADMGGDIDTQPQPNTMQYFYLRGHEFGQACSRRRFTRMHNFGLPSDNVDIVCTVVTTETDTNMELDV